MSLISKLTPINLEEEKQKFFSARFNYNPQFKYVTKIDPKILVKYGTTEQSLLQLANRIIQAAYDGKTRTHLDEEEGKTISAGQAYRIIKDFLKMHRLEKRYQIVYDPNIISRTIATSATIKLKPNSQFREKSILGMLYHEIGTHVLRRINYEKQIWYKKKKRYGLTHNYLLTEEGLATIHGHLPLTNKLAYRAAIKYLAVAKAQKLNFSQLYQWLLIYNPDKDKTWSSCVRLKRGLSDTSKPGGFTKDLVYFAGFVKVWRWLKTHDFNPTDLYIGKVALEDLVTAKKLNPRYRPILPSFYLADQKRYQQQVQKIGQVNFLS